MLDRLVVVDYIEGAGGEYLSNVINSHKEFNSSANPLVAQPHNTVDVPQKWFNSQRHVIPNWADEFENQADLFLDECRQRDIHNLSVTYHLYMHPEHAELMKPLSANTRFVKINSQGHEQMVFMDFVRKVLFNPISKQQIREVKYRIRGDRSAQAYSLISLLMQGRLFGIDLVLYKFGLPINRANRQEWLDYVSKKVEVCPTNDITISYEDFFISFDKLKKSYYNLCNGLNIVPNEDIVGAMLERNKRNLDEVTEFTKNYESIKHDIFSTTP